MPNTNCLAGIRCPKCGQEDRLEIEVKTYVEVTDDGTGDIRRDIEWDNNSGIFCPVCGASGTVGEFTTKEEVNNNVDEVGDGNYDNSRWFNADGTLDKSMHKEPSNE